MVKLNIKPLINELLTLAYDKEETNNIFYPSTCNSWEESITIEKNTVFLWYNVLVAEDKITTHTVSIRLPKYFY